MGDLRKPLVAIVAALVGLGIVMVYSSSALLGDRYGSGLYFLRRQVAWALAGGAAALVTMNVDYRLWRRHAGAIAAVSIAALALVLIPGVGIRINNARRWFWMGGFSLQPSEFARFGALVYVAAFCASDELRLRSFSRGFLPLVGMIGACALLVLLEPDTGTCLLTASVLTAVAVTGGMRLRHLVPIALAVVPVVALFAWWRYPHIAGRIISWQQLLSDPMAASVAAKAYQPQQSLIALGSGGAFGVGLGQGMQKLYFLPNPYNDFILAIIGEEMGLAGTLLVVGLFMAFVYVGLKIAAASRDRFGMLLAYGVVLFIGMQALINIAVATASVPAKGISLPFVSFGGSSLIFTMAAVGVLANVATVALAEGIEAARAAEAAGD